MNTKRDYLLAQIDTAAIIHNCKVLRQLAGENVRFCPAVKCNAYGHGIEIVLPALKTVDTEMVCIARIAEAQQLRSIDWDRDILLLGAEFSIYSGSEKLQIAEWLVENKVQVTVNTKGDVESLSIAAEKIGTKAYVHVMLDSGMTRMGLSEEELTELINTVKSYKNVKLGGLYTHFATADEPDKSFAYQQLKRFNQFAVKYPEIPVIHAANSAAVIDIPESRFNMVRPGLCLYGYMPGKLMLNQPDLKPTLKLISHLMLVKKVKAGCHIGYGCTFQTSKDSVVGLVPIGYGDGYNRRLTDMGQMSIAGKLVPVVGRVSMDMTVLDLTGLVEQGIEVHPGSEVVIIDNDRKAANSVESIAEMLSTIPYDITTALGQRVVRKLI